jgi:hypothetical protein
MRTRRNRRRAVHAIDLSVDDADLSRHRYTSVLHARRGTEDHLQLGDDDESCAGDDMNALADKKTATKTAYHIFARDQYLPGGSGDVDVTSFTQQENWTIVARDIEAANVAAALRKHAETNDKGGTYVAVPARSWKPVKVTVEQQTVVKVGDA